MTHHYHIVVMIKLLSSTLLLICLVNSHASPETVPEGFESLFNGEDLSEWNIPEGDNGHWKVIDGVIDYDALSEAEGDKNLWSKSEYGDFELRLDWRIKETKGFYAMPYVLPDGSYVKDEEGNKITHLAPNADSGVYLRGKGTYQVNMWCWPIGSGEVYGIRNNAKHSTEVRAGVTPSMKADHPVGEWNQFVITVKGDRLTVVLNGHTVIENALLPDVPEKGPIALQHHGGIGKDGKLSPASSLMQFRNIFIRELK